jgi:hypothetical protein
MVANKSVNFMEQRFGCRCGALVFGKRLDKAAARNEGMRKKQNVFGDW